MTTIRYVYVCDGCREAHVIVVPIIFTILISFILKIIYYGDNYFTKFIPLTRILKKYIYTQNSIFIFF